MWPNRFSVLQFNWIQTDRQTLKVCLEITESLNLRIHNMKYLCPWMIVTTWLKIQKSIKKFISEISNENNWKLAKNNQWQNNCLTIIFFLLNILNQKFMKANIILSVLAEEAKTKIKALPCVLKKIETLLLWWKPKL